MPRLLYFISSSDEITFSTHFYILFYRFLVLHVLNDVREYWIGLTRDSDNSENWNWINDNTQINKNNEIWHKGEPNNSGGKENCALLTKKRFAFKANDVRCWRLHRGICEKLDTGQ